MVEVSPGKNSVKSTNNHDKPAISKIKSKTTVFSRLELLLNAAEIVFWYEWDLS